MVPPARSPHGFFEPSKHALLAKSGQTKRATFLRLLNDEKASNVVWWRRLMKFLKTGEA